MAKRFTDKDKWQDPWYRGLGFKHRELWEFMLDQCDAAGIWKIDLELASFATGHRYAGTDLETFAERVVMLPRQRLFIPGYVRFQYKQLNPKCRPHDAVIKLLLEAQIDPETLQLNPKLRVAGTLPATLKEKEKEKEKDKEKEKEGGSGGKQNSSERSSEKCENSDSTSPLVSSEPSQAAQHSTKTPSVRGSPRTPLENFTTADVELCRDAWFETCRHFRVPRQTLLPAEELAIARALQRQPAKAVVYAIQGARHEPKTDRFDPGDYLQLERILAPERITRFANLGVRAAAKGARA